MSFKQRKRKELYYQANSNGAQVESLECCTRQQMLEKWWRDKFLRCFVIKDWSFSCRWFYPTSVLSLLGPYHVLCHALCAPHYQQAELAQPYIFFLRKWRHICRRLDFTVAQNPNLTKHPNYSKGSQQEIRLIRNYGNYTVSLSVSAVDFPC